MSKTREQEILEQLTQLGYSSPDWDNYHINKPNLINPPPSLATPNIGSIEMTKKQLFIIKAWPKIESFYQEDEDPVVVEWAQTVQKNGQLTRIFRICFDNEQATQRWEFVFEKRIDAGLIDINEDADIRQLWAKKVALNVPSIEEKIFYSRSFDTQASSSRFKTNTEDGIVSNFQKTFLHEIKSSLLDAYQNSDSLSQLEQGSTQEEQSKDEYFKGKEFQFAEQGNHIIWTVSIRQIGNSDVPTNTWFVNTDSAEISTPPPPEKEKNVAVENPFETTAGNDQMFKSVSDVEQQEIDRQIVEQKIMEFIGTVWPKIRNFYLELPDDDISFATTVVRKNGFPTQMLQLHFDTLNEHDRYKFLFEISVASDELPTKAWAQLDPNITENYFESRTYGSYEKRGTSSRHGEEKNDYFTGFYKRWFLSELQWKLVKSFAQVGFFTINPKKFEPFLYTLGKDLEFSSEGDQITWSFSVQKLAKYPENEAPNNVWCYGITDNFMPADLDLDDGAASEVSQGDTDHSDFSGGEEESSSKVGKPPTKSKSRIRTLARNLLKPVRDRASWLTGPSGIFRKKRGVKDGKSKEDNAEKIQVKSKTLDSRTSRTMGGAPLTDPV